MLNALMLNVAPHVFYPVKIRVLNAEKMISSHLDLQDFQNRVIANIQKKK